MDVVFDRYFKESLKSATRQTRGTLSDSTEPLENMNDFLRHDTQKTELFKFSHKKLSPSNFESNKEVPLVRKMF